MGPVWKWISAGGGEGKQHISRRSNIVDVLCISVEIVLRRGWEGEGE
jgi:hypothetical protein